jgi:MATE family multidrug resistance protein
VLDMLAFAAIPLLLVRVGAEHVAAHQIVLQLLLVAFLPSMALSDALSVLVSQAIGADQPALAKRVGQLALVVGVGYALVCALGFVVFRAELVGIFSSSPTLVDVAVPAVAIGALLQFLNAAYNHYKGMLRGLSVFRFVAGVAVGCAWLLTPPLTYWWAIHAGHGVSGAWWALCVEVSVGSLIVYVRARRHPLLTVPAPSLPGVVRQAATEAVSGEVA